MVDERVLDLLERWEIAFRQGTAPSPEELAAENPHLLDELRMRITRRRRMLEFMNLRGKSTVSLIPGTDSTKLQPDQLVVHGEYEEITARFDPPVTSDELGRLGDFRIVGRIGHGGMGAVFLAEDRRLLRKVAIKLMLPSMAAKPFAKERFLREARAVASLKSDHIVTIHEVGERNGLTYLAMEYLEGKSLETLLRSGKRCDHATVRRIAIDAAMGLADVHRIGMIHRDIKPSNLWLEEPSGRLKILDFGLARSEEGTGQLTGEGAIVGTPAYMSPEQARGEKVDSRSDLFSLGASLYYAATGSPPFRGPNPMAILNAVVSVEPDPISQLNPELSKPLATIIHKLLKKNPSERFSSANEFIEAIQTLELLPETQVIPVEVLPDEIESEPILKKGSRRFRSAIKLSLVVIFCSLIATLLIPSSKGKLQIVCNDSEAELTIRKNNQIVRDRTRDREITLDVGTYTIEASGSEQGLLLSPDHFEILSNRLATVTVTPQKIKAVQVETTERRVIFNAGIDDLREWAAECKKLNHIPYWVTPQMGGDSLRFHAFSKKQDKPVYWEMHVVNHDHGGEDWSLMSGKSRLAFHADAGDNRERWRVNLWVRDGLPYYGNRYSNEQAKNEFRTAAENGWQLTALGGDFADGPPGYYLTFSAIPGSPWQVELDIEFDSLTPVINKWRNAGYRPSAIFCFGNKTPRYQVKFVRDTPSIIKWKFTEQTSVTESTRMIQTEETQGFFPSSVASSNLNGKTRFHVIWERPIDLKHVEPDRATAERVMAFGGQVTLDFNLVLRGNVLQLPATPFHVTGIDLNGQPHSDEDLLKSFNQCRHLHSVGLNNTKISITGLANLKECTGLQQLYLLGTSTDDATFEGLLTQLPKLKELNIGRTRVTDKGLQKIDQQVPNLTWLHIHANDISDLSTASLARLKSLESLGVSGTKITDVGLRNLSKLQRLTFLDLNRTKVTAQGVAEFRNVMPNCKIIWEP